MHGKKFKNKPDINLIIRVNLTRIYLKLSAKPSKQLRIVILSVYHAPRILRSLFERSLHNHSVLATKIMKFSRTHLSEIFDLAYVFDYINFKNYSGR